MQSSTNKIQKNAMDFFRSSSEYGRGGGSDACVVVEAGAADSGTPGSGIAGSGAAVAVAARASSSIDKAITDRFESAVGCCYSDCSDIRRSREKWKKTKVGEKAEQGFFMILVRK